MKFSCEKALLQSAIAVTSRAVAQKSSIPALEGLLLHTDHQLTISGYNMQTASAPRSPPRCRRRATSCSTPGSSAISSAACRMTW